jgi:hypothetical protein
MGGVGDHEEARKLPIDRRIKRRFRILAKTCRRLGEGCDIDALRRHEAIRADHDMVPFDQGFDAKAWSCGEVDRLRADCSGWFGKNF